MAALHIRDISDVLLKRLKVEAAEAGITLKEYVVELLDGAEPRRAEREQANPLTPKVAGQNRGAMQPGLASAERPTAPAKSTAEIACKHGSHPAFCRHEECRKKVKP
jgi:plasmid stability protein